MRIIGCNEAGGGWGWGGVASRPTATGKSRRRRRSFVTLKWRFIPPTDRPAGRRRRRVRETDDPDFGGGVWYAREDRRRRCRRRGVGRLINYLRVIRQRDINHSPPMADERARRPVI